MDREEFLKVYRHSLSHVMAKAVMELFGGREHVQIAIGPQIDDGFYYDFLLPRTVTMEDAPAIEAKMHEILKRKEPWTCKTVSKEEALKIFADQKFKVELINEMPADEKITVYYTGDDYVDLCRGPHVENSQELLSCAFKIRAVSGSYWRGDEKRDQLQRIYCWAYPDQKQLKDHIAMVKEAMERDHRKIGPELKIFMFDETAPGMPYFLPRGLKVYNALLDFWRRIHEQHGYQEISAPILNSKKLWEISGHWAHYKDNMFLSPVDENTIYGLKPMNCPNAIMVYKHELRSYKELPLRISQVDPIHRKEKSGTLNGLFRVQMFHQDDAHILLSEDQIEDEIDDIMSITHELYSPFGLTYHAELSTRPDDYMGDIKAWNQAEAALKNILNKKYGEGNYEINEGDGAFYGPKIDLKMKDCIGREWQMGTIQLDFQLPLNFGLKYVAKDGSLKQPVMIHRALLGSMERFIGILIENFKGDFPFWISPYQVAIVPIRPEHNAYAKEVYDLLWKNRIRVEADYSDKNMNQKIKEFKTMKDPYIIVLGDNEVRDRSVSVNIRGTKERMQNLPLDQFLAICRKMIDEYSLDLITKPLS